MAINIHYLVTNDAVPPLLEYCVRNNLRRFFLVADLNTYRVLGQRVETALSSGGIDIKPIILTGEEIAADEHFTLQALIAANGEHRDFIAVGSGTITDITRFISHRTRARFISLPTAPSVDGYTSTVAPMIVANHKATIAAHAPEAVFVDLPTLCGSPRPMIAAGLGDLLGKYTSLADWRIGALLYDEPYDSAIDRMMRESVDKAVDAIDSLREANCDGVTHLMDGLVGSGFGMLEFGDSRPASGSEHHIAHLWEMIFILQGKPAILHGAKVGVATILSARNYQRLRAVSKSEAARLLQERSLPSKIDMLDEINAAYGPSAELITQVQAPLIDMTETALEDLKTRILNNWDQIQSIAQAVPSPEQFMEWLTAVGGPTSPTQIGLTQQDVQIGLSSAHYLRDRFTMNRLAYWLGSLPAGT
jgi:glycerol-1-phosphate dehydrogenase [NAD(P)+]